MVVNNLSEPSFQTLQEQALLVKQKYNLLNRQNRWKVWGTAEFCQGMLGDFGDLAKLLITKNNLRANKSSNFQADIEHEICDLLRSVLVLANELGFSKRTECAFGRVFSQMGPRAVPKN